MGEKDGDGLGLSLSLGMGCCGGINQPPLKVNLLPKKSPQSVQNHRSSWNDLFQLPEMPSTIPFNYTTATSWADRNFGGIDMNSAPSMVDCDDDNGGNSSPNSTISSISGRRSDRDPNGDDNNAERASCSHGGDDEDGGGSGDGDAARKKLRLSKDQSVVLEETFKEHNTLNPKRKQALAKLLNLRPRQVEVWFQNRRARTKLKQTEVDCEYLKRCCENLIEENRRLQKEVQELRALKLSPQLYMHMNPPTTLTMCPSCERVAVSSTSSSTAHSAVSPSNHGPLCPTIQRPVPVNPWPFDRSISQP